MDKELVKKELDIIQAFTETMRPGLDKSIIRRSLKELYNLLEVDTHQELLVSKIRHEILHSPDPMIGRTHDSYGVDHEMGIFEDYTGPDK